MRKRNISFVADKLLWFIILILPLLFAMVFTCASMNNYTLVVDTGFTSVVSTNQVEVFTYTVTNYNYPSSYFPMITYTGNRFSAPSNALLQIKYSFFLDGEEDDPLVAYSYIFANASNTGSNASGLWSSVNTNYPSTQTQVGSITAGRISGTTYVSLTNCPVALDIFSTNNLQFISNKNDFPNCNVELSVMSEFSSNFKLYDSELVVLPSNFNIFNTYFNNLNYSLDSWFTFGERDIVYNAFNSIFGSQSNIMPIFVEGSFIPKYLTYMAWVYVLHLAFDFLVFIPRLAHKWMGGVYKDEDS